MYMDRNIGYDWGALATGLSTVAGNILGKKSDVSIAASQAEAAKAQAAAQTATAAMLANQPKSVDNTMLYLGLGVGGLALVGTIIYFAMRK
jgi:hypothetical protein